MQIIRNPHRISFEIQSLSRLPENIYPEASLFAETDYNAFLLLRQFPSDTTAKYNLCRYKIWFLHENMFDADQLKYCTQV